MHLDIIEAINRDQLVTPTDRILLRRGRLPRASSMRAVSATSLVRTPVSYPLRVAALAAAFWVALIVTVVA